MDDKELKQLEEDAKKVPEDFERQEGRSPIYNFMRKKALEKRLDKALDWLKKEKGSLTPSDDSWYRGYLNGFHKSLRELKDFMTEEQKQKFKDIE